MAEPGKFYIFAAPPLTNVKNKTHSCEKRAFAPDFRRNAFIRLKVVEYFKCGSGALFFSSLAPLLLEV